jgi:Tfp pilus assembly protein PilF
LLYFGAVQLKAELQWRRAFVLAETGDFGTARPIYSKIYSTLKNDGAFLYNYGAESSKVDEYAFANFLLERSKNFMSFSHLYTYLGINYFNIKNYPAAESNLLTAVSIVPSSLIPKYYLIKLYIEENKKIQAKYWIDLALKYPIRLKNDATFQIIYELRQLKIP